jgi:uncharacterized phosphosugar-binding protein
MANARAVWRQHVTSLVDTALDRNDAVLEDVSAAIARAVRSGGRVFAFGAGHSISLVSEMYRRAGSFRALRPVWNAELTSHEDADEETKGQLETASGYYRQLTRDLDWGPGDLCWVISNSGRNALVVEFAQEAKRRGVEVVALTSVQHSTAVPPTPGLPRLLDIADHVLDNAGRLGDAAVDLPGLAEAVAPTSTIIGAALIHSAWAGAAERLVAAGHVPDVWASANSGPVAAGPKPEGGQ